MKFIRNMSIKWKVMVPIGLVAFLFIVTCLQANIASNRMMEKSVKISEYLTEVTPEVKTLLEEQNSLFQGMKASNNLKLVIADEMKENKAVAETLHAETERFI